ncbi:MAG: hypothetical protein ACI9F1_001750, partial [Colwellia sp.]
VCASTFVGVYTGVLSVGLSASKHYVNYLETERFV